MPLLQRTKYSSPSLGVFEVFFSLLVDGERGMGGGVGGGRVYSIQCNRGGGVYLETHPPSRLVVLDQL